MDEATTAKLRELVTLSREITEQQARILELAASKKQYTLEQSRVRENLRAVGAGTSAAEPYLQRMSEMEDAILEVTRQLSEANQKNLTLQEQRDAL